MKPTLHVLLIEDNTLDAMLFREVFNKEPLGSIQMTHLLRMQEAEKRLADGGFDIVLLDMGLPDAHGLDTVRRARAAAPGVPVIVLTGLDDEELGAQAVREGAQDYVIKGEIENRALPRALRYAIERYRMQAEAEINHQQLLRYKDQFLSHVSHELRSPLFAIYQFVTIVLDNLAGELQPPQRQYLEIVLRNVRQLQSMIDDLLEVTRAQAGKMIIDLQCTLVQEAVKFVVDSLQAAAKAKRITLSMDLQTDLPIVWADPKRIRQFLIILVDNAIKFTPVDGSVQVRAHTRGESKCVTMEVGDSGPGIGPGMNEKIFERLYQFADSSTTGRNGLGLGLYICRELVIRQGGSIKAANGASGGALLTATLPVFSLARLVGPALCNEKTFDHDFTVIVIETKSKVGWHSDEVHNETCHSIRDTLQQCLYSGRDVLLPRIDSAGAFDLFFLLAAADLAGAVALSKLFVKQLDDPEHIDYADLTFAISYRPMGKIGHGPGETVEVCGGRGAALLQQIMNEESSRRTRTSA